MMDFPIDFVDFVPEPRPSERVCDPNAFSTLTHVEIDNGLGVSEHISNDLDSYLFARERLTDMQLAALSSQLSHRSSVFDSMNDDERIQFLNSRYNQNFAGVDAYRQYLVDNLDSIEQDILSSNESDEPVEPVEPVNT